MTQDLKYGEQNSMNYLLRYFRNLSNFGAIFNITVFSEKHDIWLHDIFGLNRLNIKMTFHEKSLWPIKNYGNSDLTVTLISLLFKEEG